MVDIKLKLKWRDKQWTCSACRECDYPPQKGDDVDVYYNSAGVVTSVRHAIDEEMVTYIEVALTIEDIGECKELVARLVCDGWEFEGDRPQWPQ